MEETAMKKMLFVAMACIALFLLAGTSTLAAGPDSTPPTVWGFGIAKTTVATVGCLGNSSVMVQAKAWDLNGVARAYIQYKEPLSLSWKNIPMQLKADGYWRGYIPKSYFVIENVGTWAVRVAAYDTFNNVTKTGPKSFMVTTCPTDF
jgi:hypothetical protein